MTDTSARMTAESFLSRLADRGVEYVLANAGTDFAPIIEALSRNPLSTVDLIHPDPWPKRRHWKRRFIQDENLKRLARILKQGGELRFATDVADYSVYTLARVLRSADFVWTAECADDWRRPWLDFAGTRYEAKAKREGRQPTYLTFRCA